MTDMAVHHPIFAHLYPRMARAMDRGGMADHRTALLTGLTGGHHGWGRILRSGTYGTAGRHG